MDRSAFAFKKETDNQKIRSTDNDMVNLVAIFGSDSGDLQSKISASIAKKRAYDTINKARLFLWQQKSLSSTIQQSMLNESVSGTIFTPVCFLETRNKNNQIEKSVFTTNYLSALNGKNQKNDLTELFSSNTVSWGRITPEDKNSIDLYFNTELNSKTLANDRHAVRVREMIQKIATLGSISAINLR
jgi:hypothetical protein